MTKTERRAQLQTVRQAVGRGEQVRVYVGEDKAQACKTVRFEALDETLLAELYTCPAGVLELVGLIRKKPLADVTR